MHMLDATYAQNVSVSMPSKFYDNSHECHLSSVSYRICRMKWKYSSFSDYTQIRMKYQKISTHFFFCMFECKTARTVGYFKRLFWKPSLFNLGEKNDHLVNFTTANDKLSQKKKICLFRRTKQQQKKVTSFPKIDTEKKRNAVWIHN